MLSNEEQLLKEQFEMLRSSLGGCRRNPERFLFQCIEDLLGFYTSDAVFSSEGLNGVAAKRIGAGFEEEF